MTDQEAFIIILVAMIGVLSVLNTILFFMCIEYRDMKKTIEFKLQKLLEDIDININ